jgi:hypothetical protein
MWYKKKFKNILINVLHIQKTILSLQNTKSNTMKISAKQIVRRTNKNTATTIMEGYHMTKIGNDNIGWRGAEENEYHFITKYGSKIPKCGQETIIRVLEIESELIRFDGANIYIKFN